MQDHKLADGDATSRRGTEDHKGTLLRSCAGICAQALYRWQADGGEVAALLVGLRRSPIALAAVVHEVTGRSLDSYITQAVRNGGYYDHQAADNRGLYEVFEDVDDDQKAWAAACDFLTGCWPLVERIAIASRRLPQSSATRTCSR